MEQPDCGDYDRRVVISWLKTREGVVWSRTRISSGLNYHDEDSGVFADVLRDGVAGCAASWPQPLSPWSLDYE